MSAHKVTLAERNVKAFVAVRRHRAECACGWRGEWRRSLEDAVADGDAHKAWVAEGEAAA
jgi:hypothetical protein